MKKNWRIRKQKKKLIKNLKSLKKFRTLVLRLRRKNFLRYHFRYIRVRAFLLHVIRTKYKKKGLLKLKKNIKYFARRWLLKLRRVNRYKQEYVWRSKNILPSLGLYKGLFQVRQVLCERYSFLKQNQAINCHLHLLSRGKTKILLRWKRRFRIMRKKGNNIQKYVRMLKKDRWVWCKRRFLLSKRRTSYIRKNMKVFNSSVMSTTLILRKAGVITQHIREFSTYYPRRRKWKWKWKYNNKKQYNRKKYNKKRRQKLQFLEYKAKWKKNKKLIRRLRNFASQFKKSLGKRRFVKKNPFRFIEKFSYFWLIGQTDLFRNSRLRRRRKKKRPVNWDFYDFPIERPRKYRRPKRPKGILVKKGKKWFVKIKKGSRIIFRPLKLSDFLPKNSIWRTRRSISKVRLRKTEKPKLLLRGILRARSEYDLFLLRRRKLYKYYLRFFKFIRWKFFHYRSLYKKYAISVTKYKSFVKISNQFSWYYFSHQLGQVKAVNLKDKFKNFVTHFLIANSRRFWKFVPFSFVNSMLPTSFYTQAVETVYKPQLRSAIYHWKKRYYLIFNKYHNSIGYFPKVAYEVPSIYYKSTLILSGYRLRFGGMLSNSQYHFMR